MTAKSRDYSLPPLPEDGPVDETPEEVWPEFTQENLEAMRLAEIVLAERRAAARQQAERERLSQGRQSEAGHYAATPGEPPVPAGGYPPRRRASTPGEPAEPAEPAESDILHPHSFGLSQAQVHWDAHPAEIPILSQKLHLHFPVGRMTDADLASVVGAPHDARVRIEDGPGQQVSFWIRHPHLGDPEYDRNYEALRKLGRDSDGKVWLKNEDLLVLPQHRGNALAAKMFARQVENAHRMGVQEIRVHLARKNQAGEDYFDGYKTWPNRGFNQDISKIVKFADRDFIQRNWPDADSILDILDSEGGPEWWNQHGVDLHHAVFDLTPGSRSMKRLKRYLDRLAARQNLQGR